MRYRILQISILLLLLCSPHIVMAVTTAPRISDCEIVERLTRLEEGQKALRTEINQRFQALESRMDQDFKAMDQRFRFRPYRFLTSFGPRPKSVTMGI